MPVVQQRAGCARPRPPRRGHRHAGRPLAARAAEERGDGREEHADEAGGDAHGEDGVVAAVEAVEAEHHADETQQVHQRPQDAVPRHGAPAVALDAPQLEHADDDLHPEQPEGDVAKRAVHFERRHVVYARQRLVLQLRVHNQVPAHNAQHADQHDGAVHRPPRLAVLDRQRAAVVGDVCEDALAEEAEHADRHEEGVRRGRVPCAVLHREPADHGRAAHAQHREDGVHGDEPMAPGGRPPPQRRRRAAFDAASPAADRHASSPTSPRRASRPTQAQRLLGPTRRRLARSLDAAAAAQLAHVALPR
eukprot:CAMPEP_0203810306 /NCGR_PEP_ID=MMETSP0115-20131106/2858_1 /ASSEMBLY_ACC=CAM_ASM_000227 /TAXON_ID=33651 /ORGANISM="Bicosoecid sp, Strain ms1" /LENGTH=305 /DNA_ID=CAMNT_0050719095 /DNA_START=63 /DNA_END=977 /DNA_ORIENTATION=+